MLRIVVLYYLYVYLKIENYYLLIIRKLYREDRRLRYMCIGKHPHMLRFLFFFLIFALLTARVSFHYECRIVPQWRYGTTICAMSEIRDQRWKAKDYAKTRRNYSTSQLASKKN